MELVLYSQQDQLMGKLTEEAVPLGFYNIQDYMRIDVCFHLAESTTPDKL